MKIKGTAFLLCMLMILNLTIGYSQHTYAEKENSKTIEVLHALGVIGDTENFKADELLTRGEAATMLLPYVWNLQTSGKRFSDVSPENSAYQGVSAVSGVGIMNGYADGTFGVDDAMTLEQLAKAIVNLLGYGVVAESKGGYPNGYVMMASGLGVLDNMSYTKGAYITKGNAAQMLYNALEVDLMLEKQLGSQEYEVEKGNTLLSSVFKASRIKGVIQANNDTSIYGSDLKAGNGKVIIDSIPYNIGTSDADQYLGYYVEFYAKEIKAEEDLVILCVIPLESKNNVTKVFYSDIANVTLNKFEYYENSELQKVNLSRNVDLVYNGSAKSLVDASDLRPAYGWVTLVDNNNDGEVDIIFVDSIIIGIADSVNVTDKMISLKHGQGLVDLSLAETYQITKDGAPADVESIAAGDVLSIRADKEVQTNGKLSVSNQATFIQINISSSKVSGAIKEVGDDYIIVGKKKYYVTPYYQSLSMQNIVPKLKPDQIGDFTLDENRRVVQFESKEDIKEYGYLISANLSGKLIKKAEIKVVSYYNEIEQIKLSEYIKLDGKSKCTGEDFIKTVSVSGVIQKQLIGFKRNAGGIITEIDTLTLNPALETDSDSLIKSVPKMSDGKYYYRGSDRSIGAKIIVSEDATVFLVPLDSVSATESDFSVKGSGYFQNNMYYYADGYNFKNAEMCDLLVVYYEEKIEETTGVAVVDKITNAVNRDGNKIKKIYLYEQGGYGVYETSEETLQFTNYTKNKDFTMEDLSCGDVIRFVTDKYMQITSLEARWDADANNTFGTTAAFKDTFRTVFGSVYAVNGNVVQLVYNTANDLSAAELFYLKSAVVMTYDREKKEMRTATNANIRSYLATGDYSQTTKMFIYSKNGSTLFAVLY